jgi:pimeloyl-ACP methyl ester carboxylesterase
MSFSSLSSRARNFSRFIHCRLITCAIAVLFCLGGASWGADASRFVRFAPGLLSNGGPFPSDELTQPDPTQATGLRVQLPPEANTCDLASSPSVCSNVSLLNQFDGFSINPRIMVCFSGPVTISTLPRGIFLVPRNNPAQVITINQVIYDDASNCAFAKPDQVLSQQTKYVLAVTNSVQDDAGRPVRAEDAFRNCQSQNPTYCRDLADAVDDVRRTARGQIVSASLFTTMSVTTWLESVRDYVHLAQPGLVLPAGGQSVFVTNSVSKMTWNPAQSTLPPQDIPMSAIPNVGKIAFGTYMSPSYLNPNNSTGAVIPASPTAETLTRFAAIPQSYVPVSFHIFLPKSDPPPSGYPVVIYGHGLGDSQFGAPTFIADTLAQNGIATLAIEIPGHGYGASSTVSITDRDGVTQQVSTPGRGVLNVGKSVIGDSDGCISANGPIGARDCGRQTAVDLMAMVRVLEQTQGLRYSVLRLELDPDKIFYVGQSFGSIVGGIFHAVEPDVKAAVLSVAGGTSVDIARLAITARPLGDAFLASLMPPPLNVAAKIAPPQMYYNDLFNDDYPFRGTPRFPNKAVPGALAVQAAFEAADWLGMVGDPLGFAEHLKRSPLRGVPPKATLFQSSYGDLEVPNPTNSALIRAAGENENAWFFLFQNAERAHPELLSITIGGSTIPALSHAVLSNPTIFDTGNEAEKTIALAEQKQAAEFFNSGGAVVTDPNNYIDRSLFPSGSLFEVPGQLPESLNYLPEQLQLMPIRH